MKIKELKAYEVLDSRGNPTVEVDITLFNGTRARAAVPSGASTGEKEAMELRDKDKERFGGKGVLKACDNVEKEIFLHIKKIGIDQQRKIDQIMIELDGTENKSKLGANATLAVSLACARAGAENLGLPLWKYLKTVYDFEPNGKNKIPTPLFNLINGGAHADSRLDIQEFFTVPSGIRNFKEQLRAGSEIFQALKKILSEKKLRIAVGNEGGFAPRLKNNEEALALIIKAIKEANYKAGKDVKTGVDAAASEFYDGKEKKYVLKLDKKKLDAEGVVELFEKWIEKYHMEVIEDPMNEFDWEGWALFNRAHGKKVTVMGDDLTVTNRKIVSEANIRGACNGVIIKPNQIGTLSEAVDCIQTAQGHGMKVVVSHRSGETIGDFVSDLAVAVDADYVKFGAPSRGERVCKYNRLLRIERSFK